MPHGDMRVKQNKARLGEPGRGIIQFENILPLAKYMSRSAPCLQGGVTITEVIKSV